MALSLSAFSSLDFAQSLCDQYGGDQWLTNQGLLDGDLLVRGHSKHEIIWCLPANNKIIRKLTFKSRPIDAMFCYLEISHAAEEESANTSSSQLSPSKSLVVATLLANQTLSLSLSNGDKYDIYLPAGIDRILSTPYGLLLQAKVNNKKSAITTPFTAEPTSSLPSIIYQYYLLQSIFTPPCLVSVKDDHLQLDGPMLSIANTTIVYYSQHKQEIQLLNLSSINNQSNKGIVLTPQVQKESSQYEASSLDKSHLSMISSSTGGNLPMPLQFTHHRHHRSHPSSSSKAAAVSSAAAMGQPLRRHTPSPRTTTPTTQLLLSAAGGAGGGEGSNVMNSGSGYEDSRTLQSLLGVAAAHPITLTASTTAAMGAALAMPPLPPPVASEDPLMVMVVQDDYDPCDHPLQLYAASNKAASAAAVGRLFRISPLTSIPYAITAIQDRKKGRQQDSLSGCLLAMDDDDDDDDDRSMVADKEEQQQQKRLVLILSQQMKPVIEQYLITIATVAKSSESSSDLQPKVTVQPLSVISLKSTESSSSNSQNGPFDMSWTVASTVADNSSHGGHYRQYHVLVKLAIQPYIQYVPIGGRYLTPLLAASISSLQVSAGQDDDGDDDDEAWLNNLIQQKTTKSSSSVSLAPRHQMTLMSKLLNGSTAATKNGKVLLLESQSVQASSATSSASDVMKIMQLTAVLQPSSTKSAGAAALAEAILYQVYLPIFSSSSSSSPSSTDVRLAYLLIEIYQLFPHDPWLLLSIFKIWDPLAIMTQYNTAALNNRESIVRFQTVFQECNQLADTLLTNDTALYNALLDRLVQVATDSILNIDEAVKVNRANSKPMKRIKQPSISDDVNYGKFLTLVEILKKRRYPWIANEMDLVKVLLIEEKKPFIPMTGLKMVVISPIYLVYHHFLSKLAAREQGYIDKVNSSNNACMSILSTLIATMEELLPIFPQSTSYSRRKQKPQLQDLTKEEWLAILAYYVPKIIQKIIIVARRKYQHLSHADNNSSQPAFPSHWQPMILAWLGRHDLAANHPLADDRYKGMLLLTNASAAAVTSVAGGSSSMSVTNSNSSSASVAAAAGIISHDGLDIVEQASSLRFPLDHRLQEVCRLLNASKPMFIHYQRSPEISEVDYRSKLQDKLILLCRRQCALLVGRGMVTIATCEPLQADILPIPSINLTGKLPPPANSTVVIEDTALRESFSIWPDFHNGVAAALRIGPKQQQQQAKSAGAAKKTAITRNWIIYNKTAMMSAVTAATTAAAAATSANNAAAAANDAATATSSGNYNNHAGFLYGLGLLGHLSVLTITDICDYLTMGYETMTTAVLLGIAISKLGSGDNLIAKTLFLHIPTLLLPAAYFHAAGSNSMLLAAAASGGEIDISPVVTAAAIVGLGFLYCSSGNRLMVQFLLEELTRRPICYAGGGGGGSHGGTMTNNNSNAAVGNDPYDGRESLAICQAWSLAMILLPTINQLNKVYSNPLLAEVSDLKIEERLGLLITGGPRPVTFSSRAVAATTAHHGQMATQVAGAASRGAAGGPVIVYPSESSNYPPLASNNNTNRSSRILESAEDINISITAPAAMIALGILYMHSQEEKILRKLTVPTTRMSLECIRTDHVFYVALARCLVLGEQGIDLTAAEQQVTGGWIEAQVPSLLQRNYYSSNNSKLEQSKQAEQRSINKQHHLSLSTAFHLYVYLLTGYSLGIGLIYAGTFHVVAKQVLLEKLRWLQSIRDNHRYQGQPLSAEILPHKIFKYMIETCLATTALALSLVMAGSGDIDCLRVYREIRSKCDDLQTYGIHMAIHMAIGFLFLGGGRYSLKRDPLSTACLLLTCLPRYPYRSHDQQYHLQALRHLYLLAMEPRILQTMDISTGQAVSVDLEVILKDDDQDADDAVGGKQLDKNDDMEVESKAADQPVSAIAAVVKKQQRIVICKAPGLLPELNTVQSIRVINGPNTATAGKKRYYPCHVDMVHLLQAAASVPTTSTASAMKSNSSNHNKTMQHHRCLLLPPLYLKEIPSLFTAGSIEKDANVNKAEEEDEVDRKLEFNRVVQELLSTMTKLDANSSQGLFPEDDRDLDNTEGKGNKPSIAQQVDELILQQLMKAAPMTVRQLLVASLQ